MDVDHNHNDPKGRVRGLVHVACNAIIARYEAGTLTNSNLISKTREYLAA